MFNRYAVVVALLVGTACATVPPTKSASFSKGVMVATNESCPDPEPTCTLHSRTPWVLDTRTERCVYYCQ
jgi:hypothetical protein